MRSTLYEQDILSWSERQAELLRRLARGEQVNGVDWQNVVEEIEDVGQSELNAVRSYLRLMLVHLLKLRGWPGSPSADHWRRDLIAFQSDAAQRFAPSMRQRIDIEALHARAVRELAGTEIDGQSPQPWPPTCPLTLDDLLTDERDRLVGRFTPAD